MNNTNLTEQEITYIKARVRDSSGLRATVLGEQQINEALDLALAIYTAAAGHGISPELLGCVTSIPTTVLDAIQFRDRTRH